MNVTVLIPTWNRAHMVGCAIESALAQTYPCEVMVYDDGSTDGTAALIAARYPQVKLLAGEHVGMTAAFNVLFAAYQTEYACTLGSDDAMHPRRVEMQLAELERSRADVCFSGLAFVRASAWRHRAAAKARHIDISRYDPADFRTFQGNVHTGTALFRARVRPRWEERIVTGGADLLWVYELACRGVPMCYVAECLYYVRQHPGRQIEQRRRSADPEAIARELDEVYWPAVEKLKEEWRCSR